MGDVVKSLAGKVRWTVLEHNELKKGEYCFVFYVKTEQG